MAQTTEITSRAQSHDYHNTTFSYIHLELQTSSFKKPQLDDITAKSYMTSALSQFLGLHGSAISIDILKTEDKDVWIRVMREDASAVVAAMGVGLRGWAMGMSRWGGG
ncbi:hypothetical protein H4I96_02763 [Botrytis cinerea]